MSNCPPGFRVNFNILHQPLFKIIISGVKAVTFIKSVNQSSIKPCLWVDVNLSSLVLIDLADIVYSLKKLPVLFKSGKV